MVLPAIPDWKPAMRACVHALRPGGLFVFSVNHPAFEQLPALDLVPGSAGFLAVCGCS